LLEVALRCLLAFFEPCAGQLEELGVVVLERLCRQLRKCAGQLPLSLFPSGLTLRHRGPLGLQFNLCLRKLRLQVGQQSCLLLPSRLDAVHLSAPNKDGNGYCHGHAYHYPSQEPCGHAPLSVRAPQALRCLETVGRSPPTRDDPLASRGATGHLAHQGYTGETERLRQVQAARRGDVAAPPPPGPAMSWSAPGWPRRSSTWAVSGAARRSRAPAL